MVLRLRRLSTQSPFFVEAMCRLLSAATRKGAKRGELPTSQHRRAVAQLFSASKSEVVARPPTAGKNKRANSLGPDISTEGCRGFFCRAVENSELPQHFRAVFANQIEEACRAFAQKARESGYAAVTRRSLTRIFLPASGRRHCGS
jgi:hypothetical protein